MARRHNKRVTGVQSSSWAMFQGVFAAVIGLGIAILVSISNTVEMAQETTSVLAGLSFGLATGIVAIIVLPFVYFAFGWVIGYLQAFVFNIIVEGAGGVVFSIEDNRED